MVAAVEIVRLGEERFAEASAVLAAAFQDDPAWGWVLAERAAACRAPALALPRRLRGDRGGGVDDRRRPSRAAPVGCRRADPTSTSARCCARSSPRPLRLREATARFLAYGRAVEEMRVAAVPEPHWYLAGIGVDPSCRRRGIGSALLVPGIEASVRDRVPCALLTNTEENVAFYAKRGFEVIREGHTPERGPRAWMMRRKPSV